MKVYECSDDPKKFRVHINCINIIYQKEGEIILPKIDTLSMLQILLTEQGNFTITANGRDITLGCLSTKKVTNFFDTQPSFIYIPVKESWYILTWGNFIFE